MSDNIYIGPPDLHDAKIQFLNKEGDQLTVKIKSNEGRVFYVLFSEVEKVLSCCPEGMMLYGLLRSGEAPPYRYIFSNWDEEDASSLEIFAGRYEINGEASEEKKLH